MTQYIRQSQHINHINSAKMRTKSGVEAIVLRATGARAVVRMGRVKRRSILTLNFGRRNPDAIKPDRGGAHKSLFPPRHVVDNLPIWADTRREANIARPSSASSRILTV